MPSLSSLLTFTSIAALAAAQAAATTTTTSTYAKPSGPVVSLFLPDTDPQPLVASVVGVSGAMTTYAITCPQGTDGNDCGYPEPVTVTEGDGTVLYSVTATDFTASVGCTLTGSTAGVCTESFGGPAANFPGLSTTMLHATDITFFPVTVTAGATGGLASSATATAGQATSTGSSGSGASHLRVGSWAAMLGLAVAWLC